MQRASNERRCLSATWHDGRLHARSHMGRSLDVIRLREDRCCNDSAKTATPMLQITATHRATGLYITDMSQHSDLPGASIVTQVNPICKRTCLMQVEV